MTTLDHKWVSGFNNAGSLVSVENDVPSFQGMPFFVRSNGPGTGWDGGILRDRGDMTVGRYGFERFTWIADGMSDTQYNYIQAKSPGGTGYSIKMTVRTLNRAGSFANFNAVLRIPKKNELDAILNAFTGVPLLFIVEAAL